MKKRDEDEPALDEDEDDDEGLEPEPLIPEGNPMRPRGAIALGAGLLVALVVMTLKGQYAIGVPLGALGVCVAAFGALDLIGSFDDADEVVARRLTLGELARPVALFVGGAFALWLSVTLAVAGMFSSLPLPPVYTMGAAITASFLVAVVGAFRVLDALGCFAPEADGTTRPLLRRHGFWLVVLMALVYLPALGSHSLTDPWETHYGEVSREILARNDWISLWWAQDGWFWSKPVLDMWIQALAMALFGVRYHPGGMLSAVAEGREPFPEWAVRLPMFLMTVGAVYLLYRACRGVFGRRAAMLGGLVLATMPQWFLIGHQTVTDMPFVAPMVASMALFLMGMNADPERHVRAVEIDVFGLKLRITLFHVVLGAIAACALPQILYLVSRNLEIRGSPFDLRVRGDAFMSGSPGNCGLPGNEACKPFTPVLHGLYPSLQALIWAQALALLFYLNWGERRLDRLCFLAAWFFAALSTLGKGPAGVGLPVLAALAYVGVSRRWKDLLRMEIAGGALVVACIALPWFVAMYARHGQPFTDRLLFHDMFKRAFTHVHDTNEGDDVSFRFYVWQLGYAMFPWTGLAPIGLVAWLRRRERGPKSEASALLGMWFLLSFALFSLMLTKFHHYILPAVPPAAMLIGVALDEALGGDLAPASFARLRYFGGTLAASVALALGASLMFGARATLFTAGAGPFFAKAWPGVAAFVVGAAGLGVGARAALRVSPASTDPDHAYASAVASVAAIGGALLVLLVGRDMSAQVDGLPSQIRLVHLFTYNYKRPWPVTLDLSGALWAATFVGAILTLALAFPRVRRHAAVALTSASLVFAAWGIDVYFAKTAPHWGQRDTTLAYERAIQTKPGPLIAYQMNWKGENFYTGNHVAAFVGTGKKFQDYMLEEKRKGSKVFYFVAEHTRLATLQNEIDNPRTFVKLTTPEQNNKFCMVQAVFE